MTYYQRYIKIMPTTNTNFPKTVFLKLETAGGLRTKAINKRNKYANST